MSSSVLSVTSLLVFAFLTSACRSSQAVTSARDVPPARTPQSTADLIEVSKNFLVDVQDSGKLNEKTCSSFLEPWNEQMMSLPSDFFVPKSATDVNLLRKEGPLVLDDLFRAQLKLRSRLREFENTKTLSPSCLFSIRKTFRTLRFAQDFLIDWLQKKQVFDSGQPSILKGGVPHTLRNPAFANAEIRAGDLMLVRGKTYVSAMIARIGDEEAQFSHLAIVGQDAKGELHVVEALIQYGTIVTPLKKWQLDKDARVVLFRHPDEKLAKAAARAIFDVAEPPYRKNQNIRYDFEMEDKKKPELYCAEVISFAYEMASDGKMRMPLHKTTAKKFKGTGYLEGLGIKVDEFFAPADVEVDTRFELVAEYRHWPLLRQVRMQDSILTSVYSWMIDKKYRFHWNPFIQTKGLMAKVLRQMGFLRETLPTYMPLQSVQTTLQFEVVAKALEENLYAKEKEFYAQKGHSMTFRELLAVNESYRQEDCRKKQRASPGRSEDRSDPPEFSDFFYSPKGC